MKASIIDLDFRRSARLALRLVGFLIVFASAFPLHARSAADVVRAMEDRTRGTTIQARMRIIIQRPRYQRSLILDMWGDTRADNSFIRILRPKKDHGVAFLKRGRDLWQYIPRIGKEIKIEGSLMHDSWMGSDFTNDDLVRASSYIDDYTHAFDEAPSGDLERVILTPKPGAPVVWGKIVMDVRRADSLPVTQRFYDHRGRLTKQMDFSRYEVLGGRLIPTLYVMHSIKDDRRVSSTTMLFLKAQFNAPIPDAVFSKANLRR